MGVMPSIDITPKPHEMISKRLERHLPGLQLGPMGLGQNELRLFQLLILWFLLTLDNATKLEN